MIVYSTLFSLLVSSEHENQKRMTLLFIFLNMTDPVSLFVLKCSKNSEKMQSIFIKVLKLNLFVSKIQVQDFRQFNKSK